VTLRILAASSPGEVRIAALEGDQLLDYAIWRPGAPDGVGDLYRARVIARVPAMAGSFLSLDGTEGFLPDSEGASGLHEGDSVAVRVTRAAQGGKGPRLTARLAVDEVAPARGAGPLLELAERYPDAPVLIDDAALTARMKRALGDRVVLVPIAFDDGVEEQVDALAQPVVDLSTRARLYVHPTPALVAIDVDAGGAITGRPGKAAFHMAANLAIVPELARQIRLRNLSGAILVDFAGLPTRRRASLAPALQAALAKDPLRPRLLGFTALGLAEIVRPRMHPPLHELLAGPHAAGLAALRRIAAELIVCPRAVPVLRASPAIVAALREDELALPDLARRAGRALSLRSDPSLPGTGWQIDEGTYG
jgi:Ribonuclease G/E